MRFLPLWGAHFPVRAAPVLCAVCAAPVHPFHIGSGRCVTVADVACLRAAARRSGAEAMVAQTRTLAAVLEEHLTVVFDQWVPSFRLSPTDTSRRLMMLLYTVRSTGRPLIGIQCMAW